MKDKKSLDVLIIGGGPAGSAAALTLLNQTSLDVGVVESTDYTNMRVGESVSPGIMSLFRYLKIESEFASADHLPSHGIDTAWGSSRIRTRDFFFTGQGNGWNLDRQGFDLMMAQLVKKRNGLLITSTKIIDHKKDQKKWHLTALGNDGKFEIESSFVIDASGKSASFARSLGTKWDVLDYLVGTATLYELDASEDEQPFTLLESTPDGWWYSTHLPSNKRIVVFMTDSDIARQIKIQKQTNWNLALEKTRYIQKTIKDAKQVAGPNLFPAYSQVVKKSNPSDWVPAGDAVASFDPLSSIGIGHAIVSGIEAARVAYNTIKSDGRLLSQYLDNAIANFDQYVNNRKHFYGYEKRWKESPFWKRRQ